jgi:hypothetical protein
MASSPSGALHSEEIFQHEFPFTPLEWRAAGKARYFAVVARRSLDPDDFVLGSAVRAIEVCRCWSGHRPNHNPESHKN